MGLMIRRHIVVMYTGNNEITMGPASGTFKINVFRGLVQLPAKCVCEVSFLHICAM